MIYNLRFMIVGPDAAVFQIVNRKSKIINEHARVTTADVEQTTVAAFRPWRGS